MASEKETKKFVSDDGVSTAATPVDAEGGEAKVDPKGGKKDGEEIKKRTTPVKESVLDLFNDVDLSEDFKRQIAAAFEAAVDSRAQEIAEELVKENADELRAELAEATSEIVQSANTSAEEMLEGVSRYLDYVAEEFMKENAIAIESSLAVEKANRLIEGLQNIMAESKVEVTEETIDIFAELEEKIEISESAINNLTLEKLELIEENENLRRAAFVAEATRDLTESQAEQLKELSEKLNASDDEQFKVDVLSIKDRMFKAKSTIGENINEENDLSVIQEQTIVEKSGYADVDAIVAAINLGLKNKKY